MSSGNKRDRATSGPLVLRAARLAHRDITRGWHRLHNQLRNVNYDFRRTIILTGVRRGGTTWLAELVHGVGDMTMLWEPLDVFPARKRADVRPFFEGSGTPDPQHWWIPFIPQDAIWPECKDYFTRLLSGRILHVDLLWHSRGSASRPTENYLVKFVRGNCLLPWLVANFPTRPPIYLVRHPCAVVASRLRHRPNQRLQPPYVITPDRYADVLYAPFRSYLASLETYEEILAAQWCLEQSVAMRHPWNNQRWITLSYERIVKEGVDQFRALCQRLDLAIPADLEARLSRPSRTTVDGSPILEGGDQLSGWRSQLSRDQIDRVLTVVDRFGLGDVYSDALEPNYDRMAAPGTVMATAATPPPAERAA